MQTIQTIPGYRIFDYQLQLSLPNELASKIRLHREEFANRFQLTDPVSKRVSVTLAWFSQYAMMEERLINRLDQLAMGQYPFKVELQDFGSLPTHSVFIKLATKFPLQELVKNIRSHAQRLMKPNDELKPHFILDPHIHIASRLKPWQYEKGWLHYSHQSFSGRFIADSMQLLKRPQGELKYSPLRRFEFKNLPVETRQGILF